jgi:hypothetical protein
MARDIVSEAVKQAEAMKEAAYENAKSILVEAMSTNLKAAVTEAIDEKIDDDAPVEDDQAAEDSVDEATVEEGHDKDWGGDKGDESKSRRDFEEYEDEEEIADDAYDVDDDAGDEEDEEDLDEIDIEEVIEIIEDEDDDEDIDVDIDVDADDDDDDDDEEELDEDEDEDYGGNKGDESRSKRDYESAIKENKSLKKQNVRYEKALTFLKKRIDEVNLFNARLAAASNMMRKISLTKDEKERVIEHFDRARTVGEVKRTYKALTEGYTASNRTVKKQRVGRPNVQSVISEETQKAESDYQFDRMAQLAGLK